MSSKKNPFRVLIAGGGIAGLVLAHMLEKFQIDYLLLEAHSEIDPTIGASIGILPNGARILDQLDLYEPIAELADKDRRGNHIHRENGDCLLHISLFIDHIEYRYKSLLSIGRVWGIFMLIVENQTRISYCIHRSPMFPSCTL
jgi:2-polyprenyl-6-methoxyphenol hydroxylase-like FAD-dependent oxidoreductase